MLDEPNSNLDAEGDEALTRAILGLRARGAITIVVAHRPSAIAGVDYILIMGKAASSSSGRKKKFSAAYRSQSAAAACAWRIQEAQDERRQKTKRAATRCHG